MLLVPFNYFLGSFKLPFYLWASPACQHLSFTGDYSLSSVLSFMVLNILISKRFLGQAGLFSLTRMGKKWCFSLTAEVFQLAFV